MKKMALLICGALGKEVKAIVDGHGWEVDVYGVPAMHHFYPRKIVEAVERRLAELAPRYGQVDGLNDLPRSEEHTSELQSPYDLVCRLLLEKKKKKKKTHNTILNITDNINR